MEELQRKTTDIVETSKRDVPAKMESVLYFGDWTGTQELSLGNSEAFCNLFVEMSFEAKENTHIKRWYTKVYRELVRRKEKASQLRILTSKERTWISKLYTSEVIRRRISVIKANVTNKFNITPDRTLREIARVAYGNVNHLEEVRQAIMNGEDIKNISADAAAVVSEVIVDTYWEGRGDDKQEVKRVKVKGNSKVMALQDLAKIQGMYEKDNAQKPRMAPQIILYGQPGSTIQFANVNTESKL